MAKKKSILEELGAEEVDSVPAAGARGSWDMDGIKQMLMEAYDRYKRGGKPGIGLSVERFVDMFHGGSVKYSAFYARKKIMQAAEELGLKVKVTTRKDRVYIAFME